MDSIFLYTFAHPEFYETVGRCDIAPRYGEIVRSILPIEWSVARSDMWLMAQCATSAIPRQGFKIHLSATVVNAEEMLRRVVPACEREHASFKIIADVRLLYIAGSKSFGRGASSKFVTIYPPCSATFERLIEELHQRTRDLDGPYILSDMRYRDSRVVFYRYGGFQRMSVLRVTGIRDSVIYDPAGEYILDSRPPFYQLPSWIADPFGNQTIEAEDHCVLNKRYEVEAPLAFSNRGGVYRAKDLLTGDTVVVKEARPLTSTWAAEGVMIDAVSTLRREHAILERLQVLAVVPRVVEIFDEWEHVFLVQEFVGGTPLSSYRARLDVALIPFTGELTKKRLFCTKFRTIGLHLLRAISEIHRLGIVLGDLSPNNVLIDPDTLEVRLIDLESATASDGSSKTNRLWATWATPGFEAPGRRERGVVTAEDDFYALGMLLFSLVIPVQSLLELDLQSRQRILERVDEAVALPREIVSVIGALADGNATEATDVLLHWNIERSTRRLPEAITNQVTSEVAGTLRKAVERIASYIVSWSDCHRRDRLWPSDYAVFQTNPLNVAFGACGTALFLKDAVGDVPSEVLQWLLSLRVDNRSYPPGLYLGVSGIAEAFYELGAQDRAFELMKLVPESDLRFADPTVFHGSAGCGLANLRLFNVTGDGAWLERAVEAGEHLCNAAELRTAGCCWRNSADGQVHFGFAYGASGIGLFLLYLHQATNETRFLEYARKAMTFETENAVLLDGEHRWVAREGDQLTEPYWLHGAAGVGSSLIRFFHMLGDEAYLHLAEQAAVAAYSRLSVMPGQFQGLSGIGEFMLDMYLFTGNGLYLTRALDVARSILCFGIDKKEGLAFPGQHLIRVSTCFAYGSAGVGAFLHRLDRFGPRRFHDLASVRQGGPTGGI